MNNISLSFRMIYKSFVTFALPLFLLSSLVDVDSIKADPAAMDGARKTQIERGKYLVQVTACGDCHTPMKMGKNGPEPDMSRLLSGHPETLKMPALKNLPAEPWQWVGAATLTAFAGPWGVSYATNLTPDMDTGIGGWTEEVFIASLKTGSHMGGYRPIMPPMPWRAYSNLTDEDLKAMFRYLLSIPAVKNKVPEYELPSKPEEKKE